MMETLTSPYFPTMETARLILRPFDPADAPFFSSLMSGDVARPQPNDRGLQIANEFYKLAQKWLLCGGSLAGSGCLLY